MVDCCPSFSCELCRADEVRRGRAALQAGTGDAQESARRRAPDGGPRPEQPRCVPAQARFRQRRGRAAGEAEIKICALNYADKTQGKASLEESYRNKAVMRQPEIYRPLRFFSKGQSKGKRQAWPPFNSHIEIVTFSLLSETVQSANTLLYFHWIPW